MSKKFKFKSEKPREKWRIFGCGDEIELFGNREITVEGCVGVLEYSDTYLKLRLPRGALILCGGSFDIVTFEGTAITVRGSISSLEFCV